MSSWSGQQAQSSGGLDPHLPGTLFLLLPLVAVAQGVVPSPTACLTLPSAEGSSVSCFSPAQFPAHLPADTALLVVEFSTLARLPAKALQGVPGLQELHLSNNQLQELPAELLLPVPGLKVLDLTHNALAGLPLGLFRASAALCTLVLKNNRLEALQAAWLLGLKALEHLDLSSNRLQTLPPGLLANLTALRTLDLGDNQLETLPPDLLRGPLRLERLHLEGNQLRALGEGLLATQPALRYLFLSDNKLTAVVARAFRSQKQLDMLDLSNNLLSSVPAGLWKSLGKPSRDMQDGFDISSNPWVCDRNLADLFRWLVANKHRMFSRNDTRCAGPEALRGQTLLAVAGTLWVPARAGDPDCSGLRGLMLAWIFRGDTCPRQAQQGTEGGPAPRAAIRRAEPAGGGDWSSGLGSVEALTWGPRLRATRVTCSQQPWLTTSSPLRPPDPACVSRTSRAWCSGWWPCRWSGPLAQPSLTRTARPRTGTRCWAPPAAWPSTASAASPAGPWTRRGRCSTTCSPSWPP